MFALIALHHLGYVLASDAAPRQTLALCGDSITAARLYSVYIENYLLMCAPQKSTDTIQFGWGGETAAGFEKRQETSCLVFKPTAATICYGMNDGGYAPADLKKLDDYSKALTTIVDRFKSSGTRQIVVGSPGVVDPDFCKRFEPAMYNETLAQLSARAKGVAEEQKVGFADIHDAMMKAMTLSKAKYGNGYAFGGSFDGVHPSPAGHLVMAYAFLKALGCDGDIGTISIDLQRNEATATEGHRIVSFNNGAVEIESVRYPFCFYGAPSEATTASIIQFIPFNEDLNRYRLIVRNASAPRLKITWGGQSRIFTATELENGVNLAAAFLENPFSKPFQNVEEVIREQQGFEVKAKELFGAIEEFRKFAPEDNLHDLAQAIIAKDLKMRNQSREAVVPVKHEIRIEAE